MFLWQFYLWCPPLVSNRAIISSICSVVAVIPAIARAFGKVFVSIHPVPAASYCFRHWSRSATISTSNKWLVVLLMKVHCSVMHSVLIKHLPLCCVVRSWTYTQSWEKVPFSKVKVSKSQSLCWYSDAYGWSLKSFAVESFLCQSRVSRHQYWSLGEVKIQITFWCERFNLFHNSS